MIISPAIKLQTPTLSTKGLQRDLCLIKNQKKNDHITHFEMKNPNFIRFFFGKMAFLGQKMAFLVQKMAFLVQKMAFLAQKMAYLGKCA